MKRTRLLLLLALLMTAATGAWAQTSDKETPLTLQANGNGMIYIYNPKVNMHYKVGDGDKQTVTGTDDVAIYVTEGQTVQFFGNGTEITAYSVEEGYGTYFGSSVPCCFYGNIMSLVDETGFAKTTELTADYAFCGLFASFRNLSNHASRKLVLPATTLTKNCYDSMFEGCTGLTTAPALPATELAEQCYYGMFFDCTSLTTAPALPATELATQCYQGMFRGCTNLTTAPLLPATTLADYCYSGMFSGCTSLTTAPALPATTLAQSCYFNMFSGCTKLNAVTCLATDISAEYATFNWLEGVAATGTLTIAKGTEDKWAEIIHTIRGIPSGWSTDVYSFKVKLADNTKDADSWKGNVNDAETDVNLPITKLEGGEKVTLKYNGRLRVKDVTATTDYDPLTTPLTIEALTAGTIQVDIRDFYDQEGTLSAGMKYSTDGGTTKTTIYNTTNITVAKGDKVQFYGNGTQTQAYYIQGEVYVRINGSGEGFKTKVYGNIMSLLDEEGFATKTELPNNDNVFYGLFYVNLTLSDASELLLPATKLTPYCYAYMFNSCTSLTTAPKLPATTLASSCYEAMFSDCTSLTTAPKLPATTLVSWCYASMFFGCTNLTNAYVKAAYTDGDECDYMFDFCSATGAVLHTTSGNKASWQDVMGTDKDWPTWTVADDWQD